MPYVDQSAPHAGSAEVLFTSMFDEPAGTTARTLPRGVITGSIAAYATTGVVCVRAIPLPQGLVVNNVMIATGTTAAVGPTHFWNGLLDQFLNVLAVSADQGSGAIGSSTPFKLAMTVPFQVQYTGLYYVASSVTAATTAPTAQGVALGAGIANMAPIMAGTAGTQAAPPAIGTQLAAGTITPGNNNNIAAWIS